MITVNTNNTYFVVSPVDLGDKYTFRPDKITPFSKHPVLSLCDTVNGCLMVLDMECRLCDDVHTYYVYGTTDPDLLRGSISSNDLIHAGKDIAEVTGEIQVDYSVNAEKVCEVTVDPNIYEDLVYNPIYSDSEEPIQCRLFRYLPE